MEALTLGVLAGFGIAIPVGAIAVLIVDTGVRCGFRCAASAGAGAATADLFYAVLAVTGGAAVAASVASIREPLRYASASILVAIAVLGLRKVLGAPPATAGEGSDEGSDRRRGEHLATYARFLGLTIVNPLTVVYFATIVLGSGLARGLSPAEGAVFAVGAFLASLSWQMLLAATGWFTRDRLPRRFHTAVSVLGHTVVLVMAVVLIVG